MGRSINISGTQGKTYNLDEIELNTRTNSENELLVQVWEWNPHSENEKKRSPNPSEPKVGQIWLSVMNEEV